MIEVTEAQAAELMADPQFYVGYDEPDWNFYHAPRA